MYKPNNQSQVRPIRSYVRRAGRLTKGQKIALQKHWLNFGLDSEELLDIDRIFAPSAPLVVEIGFGDGEALIEMALAAPEINFIGIEVHRPGLGRALLRVADLQLGNVRFINNDTVVALQRNFPASSIEEIKIFFPDPWPKKKHHKRRLIQAEFAALATSRLQLGGRIHFATDWRHYAEQAVQVFEATAGLENLAASGLFLPRPHDRPITKFERRGRRLGHGVWDIVMQKTST